MRRPTSPLHDPIRRRSSLRRPVTTLLVILFAISLANGFATTASAGTWIPPAFDRPAKFLIESIAVEGVRQASVGVILSESLLRQGLRYSESELREAVFRVNRLPFIVSADFSLAKGSERGRHRLLINVEEAETFFFGSDLIYNSFGGSLAETGGFEDDLHDTLTAGVRAFAGQGMFFAAVGDSEDLQVGYTRYRLLDRPVLLRLAYEREQCCSQRLLDPGLDPGLALWTHTGDSDRLEMTLGIPLGGNHSLRFDASHVETDSASRRQLGGRDAAGLDDAGLGTTDLGDASLNDLRHRELELAWVYDTTDDPVFPNRGDAVTTAIGLRQLEGDLTSLTTPGSVNLLTPSTLSASSLGEFSSRLVSLSLYGARHWPIASRQTVSLSLKLLLGRAELENVPTREHHLTDDVRLLNNEVRLVSEDVDTLEADLGVRYSVSLWGPRKIRRLGELRWETVANLLYVESSPILGALHRPLWGISASSSLALRNTWGVFRIGFAVLDYDGDL